MERKEGRKEGRKDGWRARDETGTRRAKEFGDARNGGTRSDKLARRAKGNPSLPRQSAPRGFGNDGSTPVLITSRSRGGCSSLSPMGPFHSNHRSRPILPPALLPIPPSYLNGRSSLIAHCAFFSPRPFPQIPPNCAGFLPWTLFNGISTHVALEISRLHCVSSTWEGRKKFSTTRPDIIGNI